MSVSVLLVEGNEINQRLFKAVLASLDYGVDIAASGLDAIESAHANTYDLILMDIHMSDMSGNDAAHIIRTFNNHYARIPILALRDDTRFIQQESMQSSVFSDILMKPISPSKMMQVIFEHLGIAPATVNFQQASAEALIPRLNS